MPAQEVVNQQKESAKDDKMIADEWGDTTPVVKNKPVRPDSLAS